VAWIVLVISAVLEAVWANALGQSDGFHHIAPTAVFVVTFAASVYGLAVAVRQIPLSTGYAVWTGLGAAFTVGYATVFGGEALSVLKGVFLSGVVVAVVGLKLATPAASSDSPEH
jgi:quaternary ammonium compound-resistance protein SugE